MFRRRYWEDWEYIQDNKEEKRRIEQEYQKARDKIEQRSEELYDNVTDQVLYETEMKVRLGEHNGDGLDRVIQKINHFFISIFW